MSRARLAVVATHPVQYYAPLFRRLAERGGVEPHVFYGWTGAAGREAHDPGFGRAVEWDIPLLEGYASTFVENVAEDPGTHHFGGIDTPDLTDRVAAWEPDAVLVIGWSWKGHLQALRRLHGRVPVLFRGDSTLLDERPGPRRWARRLWLRWVYHHVDLALYVGTHNRAYFRAHGLSDDQLVWAPHSVDNERFADAEGGHGARAQAWRAELGVPPNAPTFVFVGKMSEKKAPEVLVEAFLGLPSTEAHLIFAGSGPLEQELRDRAAGAPHVHFVGFQNQSQMPAVYRLGDALVLPSRTETWGLAVNEAMACGRPAVVSDRVGCAPDLVREGETGHVVPAGDAEALRAVLAGLSARPGRLRSMGDAARRLIGDWTLDRQADAIEQVVAQRVPGPSELVP